MLQNPIKIWSTLLLNNNKREKVQGILTIAINFKKF